MEEKILGFRLIKIDVLFFSARSSLKSDFLSFAFDFFGCWQMFLAVLLFIFNGN